VEVAPDISTADLEHQKRMREILRFENENNVIAKPNHLTGVIEQIHINQGTFHEQYHNF
jgi:hypothetical protein